MSRIAFVSSTSGRGGSDNALASLAVSLSAKGHEVVVVLLQDGPLRARLEAAHIGFHVVQPGRMRSPLYVLRTALSLGRLLWRFGAEIVIASEWRAQFTSGLASITLRMPQVWWQQGRLTQSVLARMTSTVHCDLIICGNPDQAYWLARTTRRKVRVIAPASDQSFKQVDQTWKGAHAGGSRPLIGVLGRVEEWKGQGILVEAAKLLSERGIAADYAVVGSAEGADAEAYMRSCKRLADRYALDGFAFIDHTDNPQNWLAAFDILVSTSKDEPFGLVIVEGLAMGRIVVAHDSAGPSYIIKSGLNGLLYKDHSGDSLADSLETALTLDAARIREIAAEARRRAGELSLAKFSDSMEQTLTSIIDARTV